MTLHAPAWPGKAGLGEREKAVDLSAAVNSRNLSLLTGLGVISLVVGTALWERPEVNGAVNFSPRPIAITGEHDFAANWTEKLLSRNLLVTFDPSWTNQEQLVILQTANKTDKTLEKFFGSSPQYVTKVNFVRFTPDLKKTWGPVWENRKGATACDPSTGICTVYLDDAPQKTPFGVASNSTSVLAHEYFHLGGWGELFESAADCREPANFTGVYPSIIFSEENLAFFTQDLVEQKTFGVPPKEKSTFIDIVTIDPEFFIKVADRLPQNGEPLAFPALRAIVEEVSPKVLPLLRW